MISESEFTVQGHGVHTAHREMVDSLSARRDAEVFVNGAGGERDFDVVHLQTFGFYAMHKLLFPRGAKRVVSVHVVPKSLIGSIVLAKYWMPAMRLYMKRFYGAADLLLACSGMVKDALVDELKLPAENVRVLYNTVDMSRYQRSAVDKKAARANLEFDAKDFVVVGNGQLQPRKRIDAFIEVAKRMPEVKFVWIGGIPFKTLGADAEKMQKMVKKAPKNVIFTGLIPHEKVKEYLFAADAFFLPAEQENHPMAVLEAAGTGLPIVLRDLHEYDDTFRGDAFFGVKTGDFVKIFEQLRTDKDFYKKGADGAKKIAERFDSKAGGERLMEFYREVLG
jgi:1,2-diacylglycerol-3-alpha-glucose alpha-1,2-galactosyltransferase